MQEKHHHFLIINTHISEMLKEIWSWIHTIPENVYIAMHECLFLQFYNQPIIKIITTNYVSLLKEIPKNHYQRTKLKNMFHNSILEWRHAPTSTPHLSYNYILSSLLSSNISVGLINKYRCLHSNVPFRFFVLSSSA